MDLSSHTGLVAAIFAICVAILGFYLKRTIDTIDKLRACVDDITERLIRLDSTTRRTVDCKCGVVEAEIEKLKTHIANEFERRADHIRFEDQVSGQIAAMGVRVDSGIENIRAELANWRMDINKLLVEVAVMGKKSDGQTDTNS